MSIINSDGKNTNWQLNVLKGLDSNKVELGQLSLLLTSIANALTPVVRNTTVERLNSTGTIPANVKSVSISNVGLTNGTVKGTTVKAGETVNFDAGGLNNVLDSINYDATGTEFLIIYIS